MRLRGERFGCIGQARTARSASRKAFFEAEVQ
jgi:hypothetical protein